LTSFTLIVEGDGCEREGGTVDVVVVDKKTPYHMAAPLVRREPVPLLYRLILPIGIADPKILVESIQIDTASPLLVRDRFGNPVFPFACAQRDFKGFNHPAFAVGPFEVPLSPPFPLAGRWDFAAPIGAEPGAGIAPFLLKLSCG
jgi:hypothetical protein